MPSLTIVTAAAREPLDVDGNAGAKKHLRIDFGDDDGYLQAALIPRVRSWAEERLGRQIITATWKLTLPSFYQRNAWAQRGNWNYDAYSLPPLVQGTGFLWTWCYGAANRIRLPRPPLQSVSEVAYYDTTNTRQVLATTAYQVTKGDVFGEVWPGVGTSWPPTQPDNPDAVEITFNAGYGDAPANVPPGLSGVMMALASFWYVNRDADVPEAINRAFAPFETGSYQ